MGKGFAVLEVDPEFKALIRPLRKDEYLQLEVNLSITYVLIGLTQLGTRCGYSPCEADEYLIASFPPIKPEAEFVQVRLKLLAAAVISAEQDRFQVTDGFVQPVQIAGFVLFRVQHNAGQVSVTSVTVTLDFGARRNCFVDDLLKRFARDVFHDLHPRKQRGPIFRF